MPRRHFRRPRTPRWLAAPLLPAVVLAWCVASATATTTMPPRPKVAAPSTQPKKGGTKSGTAQSGSVKTTPKSPPKSTAPARPPIDIYEPILPTTAKRLNPDLIIRQNPAAAARAQLPSVYAPTRPRTGLTRYPWKTNIVTTVFWIGEPSTGVTAACNTKSSWDTAWQVTYGGYDDPDPSARQWDFSPKAFQPKQNPFYIALPFNDVTNPEIAPKVVPWFASTKRTSRYDSTLKGRWVAIRLGKKICYAQWEDVGPFETDDWEYVFGKNPQPKTVMNNGVGLDVSPAVRDYLSLVSGVRCDWRFCDVSEVPDGPWRKFGSNNPFVKSRDRQLADRIARMAELERQRDEWLKRSRSTVIGY